MKTINVWAVTVEKSGLEAKLVRFRSDDLEGMQQFVGGSIEVIFLHKHSAEWREFILVCNEMPDRTKLVPLKTPFLSTPIFGNFFICRTGTSRFAGVTKADVARFEETELGKLAQVKPAELPVDFEELRQLAKQADWATKQWRKKGGPLDRLIKKVRELP